MIVRIQVFWRAALLALVLLLALGGAGVQASRSVLGAVGQPAAGARQRVIVELRLGFVPEGVLGADLAVQAQRTSIRQAQLGLLSRMRGQALAQIHTFRYTPYIALEADAAALQALRADPAVASVVADLPVPPTMDASNGLIGAPVAWAAGATGSGQTVAVLDTGVDSNHAFLSGQVVAEACYSTTNSSEGSSSLCPGGASSSTATGSGLNCSGISGCEHGTHVAGTIAGNPLTVFNSTRGTDVEISGVAPDANLIAIQVFSRFVNASYCGSAQPCVLTWNSDQMRALEQVYALRTTYNIAAVNMSLGGSRHFSACDSDTRKPAIDNLRAAGIATVIASGNAGYSDSIGAPACISSAVAVGSTTVSFAGTQDQVSSFSNSSALVSLLAPGERIFSSVPGGSYAYLAGTSMASPHVAGAWAVLKSAAPSASVAQVLSAFTSTGVSITAVRGGFPNVTKPRIQVDAALAQLFPAPLDLAASVAVASQITLTWSDTNAYETGFVVERSPDGSDDWAGIGTAAADATSFVDTSPSCDTPSFYRVRGTNGDVSSVASNVVDVTLPCSGVPTATPTVTATPTSTPTATPTTTPTGGTHSVYLPLAVRGS